MLLGVVMLALPAPTAFAADHLPDLGMLHPSDLTVQTSNGRKLLRYTQVIVNGGIGPFEIHGVRPDTASPMTVTQRIYDDSPSGYRDVSIPRAEMFYAGDGHNHWHVKDLETGELIRHDIETKVSALGKHGFCFYDNYKFNLGLPGAPLSPVYTNCGNANSLSVDPGLSVGWGDRYSWSLAYQYIDITGLPPGQYRLRVSVNTTLGFQESSYTNDVSWVDILLVGNNASIIAKGPAA